MFLQSTREIVALSGDLDPLGVKFLPFLDPFQNLRLVLGLADVVTPPVSLPERQGANGDHADDQPRVYQSHQVAPPRFLATRLAMKVAMKPTIGPMMSSN